MTMNMSRADAERWYAARSLIDLGQLTAAWLEGELESQPGYAPGYGPDEETNELVPVLAAVNRAGYLTMGSQPGHDPQLGYNGRPWSQRAAVDGLVAAETSGGLVNSANAAGLVVIHYAEPRRPFRPRGAWVDVTRYRAHDRWVVTTGFGTHLSRRDLRFHFMECHRATIRALYRAHQVTVIAPDYGADSTVWDVLHNWADAHA